MKSYCKGLCITRDLVSAAYDDWSKGAAGRKNRWRVDRDFGGSDAFVDEITDEIVTRSLTFDPIRRHKRHEPTNGKLRIICVESVKQQVCDYLAVMCLSTLLDAKVGYYQIGSVAGKGGVFARDAIRRWAHEGVRHRMWYVKSDVRHCYESIDHMLVMSILRKYVRSDDVLYLCECLIDTYETGLDIGSYFSLKMSQLVLSFAYHRIEGITKERRGHPVSLIDHQIWNMDDCLFMGTSKRDLKIAVRDLEVYMANELGLTLKPWKVCLCSDDEPIDICGYRITPNSVTLRKTLFVKASRSYRRFENNSTPRLARRCTSYWGWLKHSDSEQYRNKRGVAAAQGAARKVVSVSDGK